MKTKQWTYSLPAKIGAFFVLIIMACTTAGSVAGMALFVDNNFYTRSIHEIKEDVFSDIGYNAGRTLLWNVLDGDTESAATYCKNKNLSAVISEKDGSELWSSYNGKEATWKLSFDYEATDATYVAHIYIDDGFQEQNEFSFANKFINIGFALRYWVYPIGILALILTICSFIFLLCSAGHKTGQEEVYAGGAVKIPFDLLTALLFIAVMLVADLTESVIYGDNHDALNVAMLVIDSIATIIIGTLYSMNFAVRIKLGGWWKNTVIFQLLLVIYRICKAFGRGCAMLMRNLPFIWKAVVLVLGITLTEFLGILVCYWETDSLLVLWFLEKLVLIPAVLYVVLVLRRLQNGSQALAKGDLSYQVDTKRMVWDFKQHGENLNSIGVGMTHAVDDRLKSERFKTELITNVSHDIKTPLTSIINYADLIYKEQTENEKVTEYAEVLLRQSERLKKLIEDLVEASKASTGNVDVLLAPCEVGVLLTQTVGEYEQRLQANSLELITKQQNSPIMIMADGRHIWRVFDNLMNNICKYAQSGTRVYLNVEEKNGEAVISFKNTSKYPLDISTEELLERFVRGDSSRNTDGNGLGLSIAQSLTELQNGKLELTVDGDLFKVVLRFNSIH